MRSEEKNCIDSPDHFSAARRLILYSRKKGSPCTEIHVIQYLYMVVDG